MQHMGEFNRVCNALDAIAGATKMTEDNINNPPHYTSSKAQCSACEKTIECIDVTRHLSFNIGNAIKYLWRCDLKGSSLEDLKKAQWYINDEIKMREVWAGVPE